jgi:hypothetical protein
MKTIKKILLIPLLLLSLVSCTEYETVTYTDTIVNKEIRSERDNIATWWWEVPMNKKVYYFILQEYGERETTEEEYSKYKIGDTYSWEVKVPKKE